MLSLFAEIKKNIDNKVRHISGDGAPTDGTTGASDAGPGSIYTDYTNKKVYVNSGTLVSPAWVLIGTQNISDTDGLGVLRVARATFDPSANAGERTIAAHGLGVTIPDNAVIVGGFYEVITTFTSATDAATIAIHANAANDIVSAVAISTGTPYDAGRQAIIPKANTPESTSIKLTAARELTATVAVEALTAGKLVLFIYYVQGD